MESDMEKCKDSGTRNVCLQFIGTEEILIANPPDKLSIRIAELLKSAITPRLKNN
jgi:hypothetical protein